MKFAPATLRNRIEKLINRSIGCEVKIRLTDKMVIAGEIISAEFLEMRLNSNAENRAVFKITLLCGYPVREIERSFELYELPYGGIVQTISGVELA